MSEEAITQNKTAAAAAEDENHIIAERRAKLAHMRETGVAYPNDFVRKDLFGDLREKWGDKSREELEAAAPEVAVSGRMMLKRVMGKASFATVRDFTGSMQYFVGAKRRRPRSLCALQDPRLGRHRRRRRHAFPHEQGRALGARQDATAAHEEPAAAS